MFPMLRLAFLVLSLISVASAQRFIIVDPLNGPGTTYTDIPTAFAAANDGDTVLYRNPVYSTAPWTLTKAITLIPDVNSSLGSPSSFVVSGIAQGKTVALVRLNNSLLLQSTTLSVTNCQGSVVLDNCIFQQINITNSALVVATRSSWRVLSPRNSRVVVSGCYARAQFAPNYAPLIQSFNSRIDCADCVFIGDDGDLNYQTCSINRPVGTAITLDSSSITFYGDHTLVRGGYMNGGLTCGLVRWGDAIAATNQSTITTVPGMLIGGPFSGSYTLKSEYNASLTVVYPNVTESIDLEAGATPLASLGLFMSYPGLPRTTPLGELYLDPAATWWITNGTCDAAGRWNQSYQVPALVPRGLTVLFQAGVVDASVGFHLTTPSTVCLTRRSDR